MQPHQMTKWEYWVRLEPSDTRAARDTTDTRAEFIASLERYRTLRYEHHRLHVERALREGKHVSQRVLKDYDDIRGTSC